MQSALRSENRPIPAIPTVTAVLFQPEDYPRQQLALRYALEDVKKLLPGMELGSEELSMSQADSFSTGRLGREC